MHDTSGRGRADAGDDDLLASWRLFSEAYLAVTLRLSEGLDATGHLALPQFDILVRLLRERGHAVPLGRIAAEIGLSAGGFDKLITRMEIDGLLVCERVGPGPTGVAASVTDHGAAVARAALDRHLTDLRRHLLAPLGVDGLRALDGLTRVLRDQHELTRGGGGGVGAAGEDTGST